LGYIRVVGPLLAEVIATLDARYTPEEPPSADPYELALWENVAYLVDDARRRAAFEGLRAAVGFDPESILRAPEELVAEAIADGGMQPARRVEKVQRCAAIAREIGRDKLAEAVKQGGPFARKMLKRFPGIGDPGADKLLLFAGTTAHLAPESNGLRVLGRIGWGEPYEEGEGDYARSYRSAAEAVAGELPKGDLPWLRRAHLLLRAHGQSMCRRSHPLCELCPLAGKCAHAKAHGKPPKRRKR
jgi:endonuclease-3